MIMRPRAEHPLLTFLILLFTLTLAGCLSVGNGDLPEDDDVTQPSSGDDDASLNPSPSPAPTQTPSETPSLPPTSTPADVDQDGDSYPASLDCNDLDPKVYPGATEICNGIDDNCDKAVDEGLSAKVWHHDADGDGYGAAGDVQAACAAPDGYVADGTDCDDLEAAVHPGGTEVCDGLDNDCDGQIDEGVLTSYYPDHDHDGHGSGDAVVQACSAPADTSASDDDCNDADGQIYPGALEVCDGKDYNCNGTTGTVATDYYPDLDGDGYGDGLEAPVSACEPAAGLAADDNDCLDSDASVHPALVDGTTGTADGDGTPALPFLTIGEAVADTHSCNLILVHPGTYTEALTLEGIVDLRIVGTAGAGSTVVQPAGKLRALTLSNAQQIAIEGLTFKGNAPVDGPGGCIYVAHSSNVVFDGIVLQGGVAGGGTQAGGGMAVVSSPGVQISHSTFNGNSAVQGGGLSVLTSSVVVQSCLFKLNQAGQNGGGVFVGDPSDTGQQGASLKIDGSTFSNNIATYSGGGGLAWAGNALEVTSSLFSKNESHSSGGGGLYCPTLVKRCSFVENEATGSTGFANGGAVELRSTASISNSLFLGNLGTNGGAIHLYQFSSSKFTLTQNTFVDNDGTTGDSLYSYQADYLVMQDNIMASIKVTGGTNVYNLDGGLSWIIDHNDVYNPNGFTYGGFASIGSASNKYGNISKNPTFVKYSAGDYASIDLHLASGSPCIDTGSGDLPKDPDGTTADMGAYGGPDAL